jgi:hypothetical protein
MGSPRTATTAEPLPQAEGFGRDLRVWGRPSFRLGDDRGAVRAPARACGRAQLAARRVRAVCISHSIGHDGHG